MSEETQSEDTHDLIDVLREEIRAEDTSTDTDTDEPAAPDGLVRLLEHADVPANVAVALDDLLVEDDTMSGALHARLTSMVRDEISRRASRPVFLEQMLREKREGQSIDVAALAERISTTADTIEAVELADRPLRDLKESEIAAWVDELDLELDSAMDALEASLLRPASAYRGDDDRLNRRDVEAFVNAVRRRIGERRHARGARS